MSSTQTGGIPPELLAAMQEAADKAAGTRDPEDMRRALEALDRLRDDFRRRHGLLDLAVPAIRKLRDR
jgi:hypothetical protein